MQQVDETRYLVLHLILATEDMRVILGETSNAHDAMQYA